MSSPFGYGLLMPISWFASTILHVIRNLQNCNSGFKRLCELGITAFIEVTPYTWYFSGISLAHLKLQEVCNVVKETFPTLKSIYILYQKSASLLQQDVKFKFKIGNRLTGNR